MLDHPNVSPPGPSVMFVQLAMNIYMYVIGTVWRCAHVEARVLVADLKLQAGSSSAYFICFISKPARDCSAYGDMM